MSTYLIGWCAYLVSALGLMVVFWRITAGLQNKAVQAPLRALAAVVLLTPINIVESDLWLAPAYLVGTYDWVLGNDERAQQALSYLGLAYASMLGVLLLEKIVRRFFVKERHERGTGK